MLASLVHVVACQASALDSAPDGGILDASPSGSASPPPLDASADASAGLAADAGADASGGPVEIAPLPDEDLYPTTLAEQREALFRRMTAMMRITDEQLAAVRAIFERSKVMGQGNPKVTKYPMTRAQCRTIRSEAGVVDEDKPACGAPYMVPIEDVAAGETEEQAKACIDRYEFPGIPCEYPVVFAKAKEAAELCAAVGKRLCDAHEWEGACAGSVKPPEEEYAFGKERRLMGGLHNKNRQILWAYGPNADHKKCATGSRKSKGCTSGGFKKCGSNTYPAGSFPACKSSFGVYDQHGNAAEHMNFPMTPEELASRGGAGWTEMKGSWFIFQELEAHKDDCRWRAPDWHGTKVMDIDSHGNYHLGFRCCKNIEK